MLGNSSGGSAGAGLGHTSIGIRGYTTITPATTGRTQKKKGADQSGKVDRVVREDQNEMLSAINPDEQKEHDRELLLPVGHSVALRLYEGRAFRIDERGRTIAPVYGDVNQGNLSDSWLLAACAAVAHAQPAKLTKRVTSNGDGTFNVRLGTEDFRTRPEFCAEGYADPLPNGQRDTLWVALVEKAFAERESGSYANLEHGNPSRALEALTGKDGLRITIGEEMKLDRLFENVRALKQASAPMVLRTRDHAVAQPLHAEHNYAVLDIFEKGGERFIKIYNPWGTRQNSRTLESMTHELPLESVRSDCEALFAVVGSGAEGR